MDSSSDKIDNMMTNSSLSITRNDFPAVAVEIDSNKKTEIVKNSRYVRLVWISLVSLVSIVLAFILIDAYLCSKHQYVYFGISSLDFNLESSEMDQPFDASIVLTSEGPSFQSRLHSLSLERNTQCSIYHHMLDQSSVNSNGNIKEEFLIQLSLITKEVLFKANLKTTETVYSAPAQSESEKEKNKGKLQKQAEKYLRTGHNNNKDSDSTTRTTIAMVLEKSNNQAIRSLLFNSSMLTETVSQVLIKCDIQVRNSFYLVN